MPDIAALLRQSEAFLVDWDGCCAVDNQLLPAAARFLRLNRTRVAIVSNNSTHTTHDFLRMLRRNGAPLAERQLVLAGVEALECAWAQGVRSLLLLGSTRMGALARRMGFRLSPDMAPDAVVLLRDLKFTYPRLDRAANALAHGARLFVANPDATHPGAGGRIVPETGALLAALAACIDLDGKTVDIVGKPSAHMFMKACAALDRKPQRVVMIGDNPKTDLAGAEALGIPALHVGPEPERFFVSALEALRTA